MATSQSKGTIKKIPSTDLGSNAQAFENLAKKLHRLESKAGMSYTPKYIFTVVYLHIARMAHPKKVL